MKARKVILFIVEGITDQNSLSLILSRLISNKHIAFHVVKGDITANNNTNIQNCILKINSEIKKYLDASKFKKSDILQVIHLIDTDGTYVDDNCVLQKDVHGIVYNLDSMSTSNIDLTIERNKKKSSILNKLYSTTKISGIKYSMYYFSCNLDHVLHNEQNLNDRLKDKYADSFVEKYDGHESEFKEFIMYSDFSVSGDYLQTWNFIKSDNNSLRKFCNLGLFFSDECE